MTRRNTADLIYRITPTVAIFLIFLLSSRCLAVDRTLLHVSVKDGLAGNFVNCIWQDEKRFIWLGTENGLQRFDGYRFRELYSETPDRSLPPGPVRQILADKEHHLWLRMNTMIGVYDFNRHHFTIALTEGINVAASELYAEPDGSLLLVQQHIYRLDPATNRFKPWLGGIIPSDWIVRSLQQEPNTNYLWICADKGAGIYDASKKQFYTKEYNPLHIDLLNRLTENIISMRFDQDRTVWILQWKLNGRQVLYHFQKGALQPVLISNRQGMQVARLDIAGGRTWVYGDNVLAYYDKNSDGLNYINSTGAAADINFNKISKVFSDVDNTVWLATDNGLYIYADKPATVFKQVVTSSDRDVTFCQTFRQGFVLGTWGGGVRYFTAPAGGGDPREVPAFSSQIYATETAYNKLYHAPWCMAAYSLNGHLYFGCQGGGLIDHDPMTKISLFSLPAVFEGHTVRQIVEDKRQRLWFGLQSGQLIRLDQTGSYQKVMNVGSPIVKMFVDSHGLLWVATAGSGLAVIDPVKGIIKEKYTSRQENEAGLSTDQIHDAVQVNDSLYAIACSANFDILDRTHLRLRHYSVYDGFPQPYARTVIADHDQNLWLSTPGGLVKFDPAKNAFRSFDDQGNPLATSNQADLSDRSVILPSGRLVFAGGTTCLSFDPRALESKGIPGNVVLTDMVIGNKHLGPNDMIPQDTRLLYDQNSITVQFVTLDYLRHDLTYYYKLDGADNADWIKADRSMTAAFPSLKPRDYTLLVRCAGPDGLSGNITSFAFTVRPAFWQTWWFMLIVFCAFAFPLFMIYRARVRRLFALQQLREKVATDLHDDIGSTLTSIGILSEMATAKISDRELATDYLHRISANSQEMMDAMDDIVWAIQPSNDTIQMIVARMREYASAVLEPKDIFYRIENDEKLDQVKLSMDVRRNLFLIFKEALNNTVKYAGAGEVSISLRVSQSLLQMTIKDNGDGFDTGKNYNGNGLKNMAKRAGSIGGKIELFSSPGQGTTISLKVPVT